MPVPCMLRVAPAAASLTRRLLTLRVPSRAACRAAGFPFVLLMILVCGAELFTGNTALLPVAVYEGKATLKQLAKNWVSGGRQATRPPLYY